MRHSIHEPRIGFHHVAAAFARAQVLAPVEFSETRKEIFFNVFELEVSLIQRMIALVAKPQQSVLGVCPCALAFNDQSQ